MEWSNCSRWTYGTGSPHKYICKLTYYSRQKKRQNYHRMRTSTDHMISIAFRWYHWGVPSKSTKIPTARNSGHPTPSMDVSLDTSTKHYIWYNIWSRETSTKRINVRINGHQRSTSNTRETFIEKIPLKLFWKWAGVFIAGETGELLEYRHLGGNPRYLDAWRISFGN